MDAFRRRPHEPEDGSDFVGLAVGVFGSIVLSVADPSSFRTRKSMMLARGAMPLNLPAEEAPLAATIPATCVPWP